MTFRLSSLVLILLLPVAGLAAPAQENWENLCADCHGPKGEGKTKQGIKLKVKDYSSAKFQEEFSDTGLLKNILLGIESDTAQRMPRYKDKLTVAEAKELVTLIRSFKK